MKNILKTGLIAAAAIGLTTTATQAGGHKHSHRHHSHGHSNTVGKVLRIASEVSRAVHNAKYHSGYSSSCNSRRSYSSHRSHSSYRSYRPVRSHGIRIYVNKSRRGSSCSSYRGHRH